RRIPGMGQKRGAMKAGLDWGGSFADAVLWDGSLLASYSVPSRDTTAEKLLQGLLDQQGFSENDIESVAVTGGDARRIRGKTLIGVPVFVQDEIRSICLGAHTLSGISEAVAVSCGTGTAVAYYLAEDGFHPMHLGGTAAGGGTLEGLGRLLLETDVPGVLTLAEKGKALDLTVKDVVGKGIGIVPADATAAHFAKAETNSSKADIAASLVHLVAETIGTVACHAADKTGCANLVFTGRVAQAAIIQERINAVCRIHGKNAHFPENGEYATAIGAVVQS
ncbi:MAG: hypothetical protein Q8P02_01265, partial [Candidatus Micrarchaeota archaeon]|nr:hypothetical protein [Candidatus Micrarchaeota archaeon]